MLPAGLLCYLEDLTDIIPNLSNLIFIFLSLNFIGALKNEVVLSFLGLRIAGEPSWGVMIANARLY